MFINICNEYKTLCQSSFEITSSKDHSRTAKDRGKAEEARDVSHVFFLFTFSGCAELCDVFGCLSNMFQKFYLLPFKHFSEIQPMMQTISKRYMKIEHPNCCANDCKWEMYHADLILMNNITDTWTVNM